MTTIGKDKAPALSLNTNRGRRSPVQGGFFAARRELVAIHPTATGGPARSRSIRARIAGHSQPAAVEMNVMSATHSDSVPTR